MPISNLLNSHVALISSGILAAQTNQHHSLNEIAYTHIHLLGNAVTDPTLELAAKQAINQLICLVTATTAHRPHPLYCAVISHLFSLEAPDYRVKAEWNHWAAYQFAVANQFAGTRVCIQLLMRHNPALAEYMLRRHVLRYAVDCPQFIPILDEAVTSWRRNLSLFNMPAFNQPIASTPQGVTFTRDDYLSAPMTSPVLNGFN